MATNVAGTCETHVAPIGSEDVSATHKAQRWDNSRNGCGGLRPHHIRMLFDLLQAPRRRPSSFTLFFGHLGSLGLFLLAILDSSPLPTFGGPDILIIILVVTRPYPWYEFAAVATAGSVIGAYTTFILARRAGKSYLDRKLGKRAGVMRFLTLFDRWGTGVLVASSAIPFPFPTSAFFAAAGVSNRYKTRNYLIAVAVSRAVRYSAVGFAAHHYGRRIIRVLRHPAQYWHYFLILAALFVAVVVAAVLLNRRAETAAEWDSRPVA